jgi:GntR family transcriptional regulator, transcriptional repressor for pyruvate dehydrogenase complex
VTVSERARAIPADGEAPRRKSASPEQIARLLTAYVTTGHLQPGARIPSERRLAEELGVGRSVVREALKSLALVGLIESRHGDGTYVADSTPESFSRAVEWRLVAWGGERADVAEAMATLDADLAALAAERRTQGDLQDLMAHLADEEVALEAGDPAGLAAAHLAFRATVAVAAGNVTLASVVEALRAAAPIVAEAETGAIDPAGDRRLLDAIRRGLADDARRAARLGQPATVDPADGRN